MIVTLTPEQLALLTGLMQAKATATRELDLALTVLRAGLGEGQFHGIRLEGHILRFLDDA